MVPPLYPPAKEVDVGFLVFVERYATDLLKWDILTFFADNPNLQATIKEIAQQVGRTVHSVRPELGDLVLLGILEQIPTTNDKILYQLTQTPHLRKMTMKFADQLTTRPST